MGMTREKVIKEYVIPALKHTWNEKINKEVLEALEQEPTTKNNLGVDCISRDSAIKALDYDIKHFKFKSGVSKHMDDIAKLLNTIYENQVNNIKALPSVTPQEPRCKDCKWWKDSDGEYRRGCGAESKCPINRREVFEGNGYCYMFEPQESRDKE